MPNHDVSSLTALAIRGLRRMQLPDGLFCLERVRGVPGEQGRSVRYSLMTYLGLVKAEQVGLDHGFDLDAIRDAMWKELDSDELLPGDFGLYLWVDGASSPGGDGVELIARAERAFAARGGLSSTGVSGSGLGHPRAGPSFGRSGDGRRRSPAARSARRPDQPARALRSSRPLRRPEGSPPVCEFRRPDLRDARPGHRRLGRSRRSSVGPRLRSRRSADRAAACRTAAGRGSTTRAADRSSSGTGCSRCTSMRWPHGSPPARRGERRAPLRRRRPARTGLDSRRQRAGARHGRRRGSFHLPGHPPEARSRDRRFAP